MSFKLSALPIIDLSSLVGAEGDGHSVATQIGRACREPGFFYIVGHGVSDQLQHRLEDLCRRFFAQDLETKLELRMEKNGRAWRGYFPVGDELTSGKPDLKEGLYFGAELADDHPLVRAKTPMHGPNQFPVNLPLFRETILEYIDAMTSLGHALMKGIALSLGLSGDYFAKRYTSDPLVLFRVFNYPAHSEHIPYQRGWGVGEHTDYGLLTILKQEETGGLQVRSKAGWAEAKPVPNSFVCNIGDMLDRMTGGLYRSTAHRVVSPTERDRLSFPFFFDQNFNAEVQPIEAAAIDEDKDRRWDHVSVHEFSGTYGDYLLGKVSKVFLQLRREIL
jgi:isopenicillin N synthase-like dioxygenase